MSEVTHVVALKFPDSVDAARVDKYLSDFLALKTECVRDGKPYIVDIRGGKNMSIENMDKTGFNFCVVVTFQNVRDRDYYVKTDEAHQKFATDVKSAVSDAFIYDFEG